MTWAQPVSVMECNEPPLLSGDGVVIALGVASGSSFFNLAVAGSNIAEKYQRLLERYQDRLANVRGTRSDAHSSSAMLSCDHITWDRADAPDPSMYFGEIEQERVDGLEEGVVVVKRRRKILASEVVHLVVRDLPRRKPRPVILEESSSLYDE